jgi:DNA-binding transcriptional MerR regulator
MTLYESSDVGRVLNLTPGMVRHLAQSGRLRVAATTPRGARLFCASDVEALRQAREAARKADAQRLNAVVEV